jgi:hypothetical protein
LVALAHSRIDREAKAVRADERDPANASTVAGFTMTLADRHSAHACDSQAQQEPIRSGQSRRLTER